MLPIDMLQKICSFFPREELKVVRAVDKAFRKASNPLILQLHLRPLEQGGLGPVALKDFTKTTQLRFSGWS